MYAHYFWVVAFDPELIEHCPKPLWKSFYIVCLLGTSSHKARNSLSIHVKFTFLQLDHMISWEFLIRALGQPWNFMRIIEMNQICALESQVLTHNHVCFFITTFCSLVDKSNLTYILTTILHGFQCEILTFASSHCTCLVKSPVLLVKSPFLSVESQFLSVESPFVVGKTPFLLVKSQLLMVKSPFVLVKHHFFSHLPPGRRSKSFLPALAPSCAWPSTRLATVVAPGRRPIYHWGRHEWNNG